MKITIITSTYNDIEALGHTAKSLQAQSFRDFQWIIADGASTDGTVEFARSLGPLVARLSSEPDLGIYDAWNKALPLIEGEWVLFLGAGDTLECTEVLQDARSILVQMDAGVTLAYGSVLMVDDPTDRSGTVRNERWLGLEGPWSVGRPKLPSHQGVFHRASLFADGFRFDKRLRISGDSELLLREFLLGHGEPIDLMVSRFVRGGISTLRKHRLRMVVECVYINCKLGIFWKRPFYQLGVIASNALKHVLGRHARRPT